MYITSLSLHVVCGVRRDREVLCRINADGEELQQSEGNQNARVL